MPVTRVEIEERAPRCGRVSGRKRELSIGVPGAADTLRLGELLEAAPK